MLSDRAAARQSPFLSAPLDEQHPDFLALDAELPDDHPARLLSHLVGLLDLGPLTASYAGRGSLAFPPHLLLAFVFLMEERGDLSPAEWARIARRDDEAKWLLRGLRPSRSLLYHFRDRLQPFLPGFHRQILHDAIAEGFCQPEQASLDGTFIPSFASRHRLVTAATVARRLNELWWCAWIRDGLTWIADSEEDDDVRVQALVLWLTIVFGLIAAGAVDELMLGELPAWMAQSAAGRLRQGQRYADTLQRLQEDREDYERRQRQQAKARRVPAERRAACLTDPEAALGRDKYGLFRPLYDTLLLNSLEGEWVLHYDVQARATDQGTLPGMLQQAREKVGITVKEVAVDDGFVNLLDLKACKEQGVVVYAPVEDDVKPKAEEKLPKQAFRWDTEEQTYYCPQGHRLEVRTRTTATRQQGERVELPVVIYGCAKEHCLACPERERCTKTPQRGREVKRFEGEEIMDELRERMKQPSSQELYKHRGHSAERNNAEMKEHRGLRVFRSYGQKRAQAQVGLTVVVMNGLRLQRRRWERDNKPPAEARHRVA